VKDVLKGLFQDSATLIPHVVQTTEEMPRSVQKLLVTCSNGCFASPFVAKSLLRAAEIGVGVLPVISEESFRFPTKSFFEELRKMEWDVLGGTAYDMDTYQDLIKRLFTEIGVTVIAQESQAVVDLRVASICQRIKGSMQPMKLTRAPALRLFVGSVEWDSAETTNELAGSTLSCTSQDAGKPGNTAVSASPLGDQVHKVYLTDMAPGDMTVTLQVHAKSSEQGDLRHICNGKLVLKGMEADSISRMPTVRDSISSTVANAVPGPVADVPNDDDPPEIMNFGTANEEIVYDNQEDVDPRELLEAGAITRSMSDEDMEKVEFQEVELTSVDTERRLGLLKVSAKPFMKVGLEATKDAGDKKGGRAMTPVSRAMTTYDSESSIAKSTTSIFGGFKKTPSNSSKKS
jgi:hypothetical protein